MTAVNFDDIGSMTLENVTRPPLAPLGTYRFQITKIPAWSDIESPNGKWRALEFQCRGIAPTEDVDMDAFQAYGDAKNIMVRKSFMFTKDPEDKAGFDQTMFNLKTFLNEHLGLPVTDPNGDPIPLNLLLNNSVNKQFLGVLRYREDKNNADNKFHDLGKTAPVA
jgi:hypothetical protein